VTGRAKERQSPVMGGVPAHNVPSPTCILFRSAPLDPGALFVQDGTIMGLRLLRLLAVLCMCATASVVGAGSAMAQSDPPKPAPSPRMTIEVTGGETNKPVENASIYLKYVDERTLRKDKKYELNVKTNRDGVAHIPDVPLGKVLIQIVAEGWKTYGKWYDITDQKQTIKIHLDKPPKWY